MSNVTVVFDRTRVSIGAVDLDVSLSESHSSANEVTDHPVESGTNIVDHVRPKPDVLKLEGLVSNTPLPDPNSALIPTVSNGQRFSSRGQFDPARAGTAYADLLALRENGTLVTVVTGLRVYDSMVIESLEVPRDARTGQTLRFSCTLKQVRLAVVQTAKVVQTTKISKGKKATKETPEPQRQSSLSALDDLSGNKGTGFLKGLLQP